MRLRLPSKQWMSAIMAQCTCLSRSKTYGLQSMSWFPLARAAHALVPSSDVEAVEPLLNLACLTVPDNEWLTEAPPGRGARRAPIQGQETCSHVRSFVSGQHSPEHIEIHFPQVLERCGSGLHTLYVADLRSHARRGFMPTSGRGCCNPPRSDPMHSGPRLWYLKSEIRFHFHDVAQRPAAARHS